MSIPPGMKQGPIQGQLIPDQSQAIDIKDSPYYEGFLKSDAYKNAPMIGGDALGFTNYGGKVYKTRNTAETGAFQQYLKSLPAKKLPEQSFNPRPALQQGIDIGTQGINMRPVPQNTPTVGQGKDVKTYMGEQAVNPLMPAQGVYRPMGQQVVEGYETIDPAMGSVQGTPTVTQTQAGQERAQAATAQDAAQAGVSTVTGKTPTFAVQQGTATGFGNVAQGTITEKPTGEQTTVQGQIDPITGRQVGQSELAIAAIGDTRFLDSTQAAQSGFVSDMKGATMQVTPDMTVEGQLTRLSAQFDGGKVPPWAAGVVRTANAQMAARGLAASSMAGAAVTQAIMEASVPIAVQDAQTYYQTAVKIMDNEQQARLTNTQNNMNVDLANTSNRQQTALAKMQVQAALAGQSLSNQQQVNVLKAERFAEAANLTFTQEQQRVFTNSKMMETVNLTNLSNRQAATLQNAASMASMDMANLNNRQQAAVMEAKNLMDMEMQNLSNKQQGAVIEQQSRMQGLLSDQASENAANQFNATSQNQVNQFYDNLTTTVSQFNSSQTNAREQFNSGQANALQQFRATMQNQREQFNVKNAVAIEQSNVAWRRNVNTANTAAVNAANQINATNYLSISNTALNNVWQQYRDEADYAYSAAENEKDRTFNYAMAILESKVNKDMYDQYISTSTATSIGSFLTTLGIAHINKTP